MLIKLLLATVYAGVLFAGMTAGKNGSKKGFFLTFSIIIAATLALTGIALLVPEFVLNHFLDSGDNITFVYSNSSALANNITPRPGIISVISPTAFILTAVWLNAAAWVLYLLTWNCRKLLKNWYSALAGMFIAAAVVTLTLPLWYSLAMWVVIALPMVNDPIVGFAIFPVAVIIIAVIIAAALIIWTSRNLHRSAGSWKTLLTDCAIFWASGLAVLVTNLICGGFFHLSARRCAEKNGIEPIFMATVFPANDHWKLLQKHPLYSPPYSGQHEWFGIHGNSEALPAEKKIYTLKNFEHPDIVRYRQLQEEAVRNIIVQSKNNEELGATSAFRHTVQHYNDLAALYQLTGQPEKTIAALQKYPELDRLIPQKPAFILTQLVRTATRMLWITGVVRHAPDAPEYARCYREFLNFSMTWQPFVPDEGGMFIIPFADFFADDREMYKYLHAPPIWYAIEYKGIKLAAYRKPKLRKLEGQLSFTPEDMSDKYIQAHDRSSSPHHYFSPYSTVRRQRGVISTARTALALKCFRAEKGRYPAKLEELVPEYLPQIYPQVDGTPMRYESSGKGFSLRGFGNTPYGDIFTLDYTKKPDAL